MQRTRSIRQNPYLGILILLMTFSGLSLAQELPERIVLSIAETPATAMGVSWRTDSLISEAELQLSLNRNSPDLNDHFDAFPAVVERVENTDGTVAHAYAVKLTDLKPAGSYAYRVGSPENWSEWATFRTAKPEPAPFSFIYLGDPQNDIKSYVSRVVRQAYAAAPQAAFMLTTGDLVTSPYQDELWDEFFYAGGWIFRHMPQVQIVGNHGYQRKGIKARSLSPFWRPHFALPENGIPELPETNYSFVHQGVRFIVLNSSEKVEEQAEWMDELLQKDNSNWIIAAMHYPIYSTAQGRDQTKRRNTLLPILDKYEVDLVLAGHDHCYGRTVKLKDGRPVKARESGTVYITSVSGPKQYTLDPKFPELFSFTVGNMQLYQVIDIDGNTLNYRAYSVDGQLIDSMRLKH